MGLVVAYRVYVYGNARGVDGYLKDVLRVVFNYLLQFLGNNLAFCCLRQKPLPFYSSGYNCLGLVVQDSKSYLGWFGLQILPKLGILDS